jgi:diguanylate cyclase (GGDEF)-like protein
VQLHFVALLRLAVPVSLVILAYWFRGSLGDLSEEARIVVNNMPYLTCMGAILMAHQFRRARLLLAALGVATLYWLIRNHLQVSLSEPHAYQAYMGASFCLPVLSLYLFLLPERGIWNIHGLMATAGFFAVGFICYSAPAWVPGLGFETAGNMALNPVSGHILPFAVTALIAAVMSLATVVLCLRNTDAEAALLAALLALYLAMALLHLEFISVAMCTAAGLCLVYGLLRSSFAMAYRDDLTGLLGRRALNERLKSLGRTYSIAMLDVDHFKKFNDKHGHDVGDQVLRLVSSRIKQVGGGTAYRYGGEEFSIVFPRKSVDDCIDHLDSLRKSIAGYEMSIRDSSYRPKKYKQGSHKRGATRIAGGHVSITISIGVAERSEDFTDASAVIRLADKNLYKAKRTGRNRVVG